MTNATPDCPEWMNSEQCAIFRETQKICNAICDALKRRDRETWQNQRIRLREMARIADERMFT